MKKFLKILGWIVGVVVVLIVAAVIIVPMVFNPNDYKDEIAAAVQKNTGRQLRIEGNLDLTVFPWLGVTTGVVELGNAKGFTDKVFARTDKVNVRVKLLPLLDRKIEMDKVIVQGLTLNLERNKQGVTNWADLTKEGGGGEAAKAPAAKAPASGAPPIAGLVVGGLDIENANVSWSDAVTGERFKLSDLSARTGALAPGKPVDLKLDFNVESGKPPVSGHVTLASTLEASGDMQRFAAHALELNVDLSGGSLPGGKLSAKLGADVTADLARQTLTVDKLQFSALDLKGSGKFGVTDLQKAPKFTGTLNVAEFNPRALLKALGRPEPVTADPKALTALSLDATLAGATDRVKIDPIRIGLDDTKLDGRVEVADFARPAVRFALAVNGIDADRYLPPPAKGKTGEGKAQAQPASPGAAATGAAGQLPTDALRRLDVDGTFKLGKLTISGLHLSDIAMTLKAKDGLIRLNPIGAKLYDGTYSGDIALDARGAQPKISANEKLAGVQAGPLLKDLQGKDVITGLGNVDLKLTATGADADAVKRTLNGTTAFSFTNGALKGINLGAMLREAQARLQGKTPPAENGPVQTDFSELTGTVLFKNGLATNDDLSMKSPLLRVEGRGNADLPKESIDYHLKAIVVATAKGQGGAELKDLAGIPVPVRITGTFAEPKYGLDLQALAQEVAKSKAGAVVEQQKQQLQKNLGDKASGTLKGLLGN